MVSAYLKQTSQRIIFQEHYREPTEHKAPPTAPGGPGKGRGRQESRARPSNTKTA